MTRNRPITIDELRAMTDEQLLAHRTFVAHTVATISADLHAHELGGTHEKPADWYRRATYARDKHRATIEAINMIREERAFAVHLPPARAATAAGLLSAARHLPPGDADAAAELLFAARALLETDPDDDEANDVAFERLSHAVDACQAPQ